MPDPRKILVIPSWYPPDGGNFFRVHSEALSKKGFKVDILVNRITGVTTLRRNSLVYLKRFNMIEGKGIRVIRSFYLKLPWLKKANTRIWIRNTARFYKKYETKFGKPDILIAHSSIWAGCAAEKIFSRWGIPYIIVEHRSPFTGLTEDAEKFFRKYYYPFLEKAFFSASRIVTVSGSLQKKIVSIEPSAAKKMLTIPNLVDTDFYHLPENPRQKEPFRLFSAGRLARVKGMELLLGAFSVFLKDHPDTTLSIAGRGPLKNELIRLTEQLGIDDRVRFLGYIPYEGIRREMHEANLFILATRYEAFGVVFIEAMATGLPVITTRSGGPEFIINESSGILVDTESEDQLISALNSMYESYDNYNQEKIREQVLLQYSKEVVMDQYAKLIDEVLGE